MRYLAYLDILGFKDLIQNNKLTELEALYENFEPILLQSMSLGNIGKLINNERGPKRALKEVLEDVNSTSLNSLIISDSAIIWTEDAHNNSFFELIGILKHYLFMSFKLGLPLRGAVTMGELSVKTGKHSETNNLNAFTTILGKPLTDAYILEGQLNSAGCIIDPKCIQLFADNAQSDEEPDAIDIEFLEEMGFIKKYLAPLKTGLLKEEYLINWTFFMTEQLVEEEVRNSFSLHNKSANNWDVEQKIRNTILFLNYCKNDFEDFKNNLKK